MKLRIKKLSLFNYAGFPSFEITFTSKTLVSGKNGLGKTTIANAIFSTLFSGRNINGTKADRHRPHDEIGEILNCDPVIAILVLEIDGVEHTIQRTEQQVWVKHRNSFEPKFEGNTTSYTVDGEHYIESKYKKWLEEQGVTEKEFRFVTSATDLLNMNVNDRRAQLIEMFGDADCDFDIAARNDKYQPLRESLRKYSVDEVMERQKDKLKQCEKVLKDLPLRIRERKEMLVDVDEEELNKQKDKILKKLDDIATQRETLLNGSEGAKRFKKQNIENDISKLSGSLINEYYKLDNDKKAALSIAESSLRKMQEQAEVIKVDYKSKHEQLALFKSEIEKTQIEYKEVLQTSFDENNLVCPTCGRPYDSTMIEDAKTHFEKEKQSQIEKINNKGQELFDKYTNLKKEIETIIENAKQLQVDIDKQKAEVKVRQMDADSLCSLDDYIKSNEDYISLNKQLLDLDKEIVDSKDKKSDMEELQRLEVEYKAKLNEVNTKLSQAFYNNRNKEFIVTYETQLEEARTRAAKIQQLLDLAAELKNEKIKLVQEKINSHFKLVRWVMFEPQINGNVADVCKATVRGSILRNDLNTGMSVLAEIDICNAFQKKLGIIAPIIIDNAEQLDSDSISKINADSQLIMFRVTDDNELKIEQGGA
jgi:DNA repair exonuclease SbcCD ATPase subunit